MTEQQDADAEDAADHKPQSPSQIRRKQTGVEKKERRT
jgi:hypothetical protein